MKSKTINTKIAVAVIAATMLIFAGCKKYEDQFPSETKTVSAPTITLIGDQVIILNVGDTYTEQGATYYDSLYGDNGTITEGSPVNTSEEGFFIITYTAENQFGFEGSGSRLVAVTSASDSFDVSGDYLRAVTGYTATVSKIGRGVFLTSNAGGNAFEDPVYFMFTGDSTMIMPPQALVNSADFAVFEEVEYDFSVPAYSYVIDAATYGTATRVFVKQ